MLLWFKQQVQDADLAHDLLSDTWERALKALPSYRGEAGREAVQWLWTIAGRVLSDHQYEASRDRRLRRRLPRRREATTDENIDQITEQAGQDDLRATLTRGLNRLPEAQREAVRLHVIEQLSYECVAVRMDTTTENTRARVSRALRKLGVQLQADYENWRREDG